MNYENKIVLLSAKAYFSTRQKTNAHEELPHRTIATHHHCHYLRYTFRKFPTGFAGTAVHNIHQGRDTHGKIGKNALRLTDFF